MVVAVAVRGVVVVVLVAVVVAVAVPLLWTDAHWDIIFSCMCLYCVSHATLHCGECGRGSREQQFQNVLWSMHKLRWVDANHLYPEAGFGTTRPMLEPGSLLTVEGVCRYAWKRGRPKWSGALSKKSGYRKRSMLGRRLVCGEQTENK